MRHRVDVEHLATRLKDDSRIGDIGDCCLKSVRRRMAESIGAGEGEELLVEVIGLSQKFEVDQVFGRGLQA